MIYLKDKKILILDESKVTLNFLKEVFLPEGAEIFYYDDLKEDILNQKYDLVFTDIIVKKKDTSEFIQKLRQSQPHLKVILHSAFPETHEAISKKKKLFDEFIKKPTDKAKLFSVLEKYLPKPLENKKVLLLEDAKVSQQAMEKILVSLGAKTYSFSEINEKEIMKEIYDIAVIDLHLGNKTSLSLIPQLKIHNPAIVILVVSSFPQTLLSEPIAESLVSYILQKPFTDKEFRQVLLGIAQKPNFTERRKEKRFQKSLTCWVARYEKSLSKAELFESPFLVDLSLSGMSFQSYFEYSVEEELIIWFLDKDRSALNLIELHGVIRWRKDPENKLSKIYSYGIEFKKEKSPGYEKYQELLSVTQ